MDRAGEGINGVVRVAFNKHVRFMQRFEGGEGELPKWPSTRSELWTEGRARAKAVRQKVSGMC